MDLRECEKLTFRRITFRPGARTITMAASIVKMAASTIGMAGAKHDIVLLHGLLSNRKGWGRFPDRLMRALDAEASDSITHKKVKFIHPSPNPLRFPN
eukprot:1359757-Amorphochlora_amoeboformis.AAC.1